MPSALSLERAPSQAVPLRFLLAAPWFACAAGLVLLWAGPDALGSRWTAPVLAVTHLLTLGFMAHAMLGALLQLLPVVAGVPVPHTSHVAGVVHPALLLGTLALASAFLSGIPMLYMIAMVLLAIAFGVYLAALALGFVRQRLREPAARVILVAALCLAGTVALGLLLAAGMAGVAHVRLIELTHLHAAWGLVGWTLLLVLGAGLAVVPMFQMTRPYPRWMQGRFAVLLIATLALWSVALELGADEWRRPLQWAMAAAAGAVAVATLVLQLRGRRRRQPDATFLFWRTGMLCLLGAAITWAVGEGLGLQSSPSYALLLGVLTVPGFALSVICGMLYKIVPFLLWLTLQMGVGGRPPQAQQIMPDAQSHPQLWVHVAAVILLAAAVMLWSGFVYPAAAALLLSGALLGVSLARATLFARSYLVRLQRLPSGSGRSKWKSIA
jgi:hypothetical protein